MVQAAEDPPLECIDPDEIGRLWMTSFPDYAKDHLKIQTLSGDLVRFELNPIQLVLNEIIEWTKLQCRLVRFSVLKARREGVTTFSGGRHFWHTSTKPNRYAFMVTHEPEATDFVFNMDKRYLSNLDPMWRPKTRYNNKRIIEFNDPDGGNSGLDSAIRVGTAGKENLGSSQLIHYLHLSELAKWQEITAEALLTSLLQCVPDEPDTEVIAESTANGIGGKFYDQYWAARYKIQVSLDENGNIRWECKVDTKADASNIWTAIFFPWFVFPEYRMPVAKWEAESGRKFVRDEEEEKIVALHFPGIPDAIVNQKLAWRRWAIENKCQGSKKIFQQEYPATDMEAFLGTGRAAFDPYLIHSLLKAAPKPIMTYEIDPYTGSFIAKPDGTGRLWVWQEPISGRPYVMGADTAEGIEVSSAGGDVKYDFSVCDVVDQLSGLQVAQWHGHIDPDLWGRTMFWIGRRYGVEGETAWAAPERNPGGHGSTAINTMMTMTLNGVLVGYPRMYVELRPDPPNKPLKKYGWHASEASIGQAADNMKKELREGTHGIRSSRTLTEMLAYKQNAKGKYEGEVGKHDDCCRSILITKVVRMSPQFPLPDGISAIPIQPGPGLLPGNSGQNPGEPPAFGAAGTGGMAGWL